MNEKSGYTIFSQKGPLENIRILGIAHNHGIGGSKRLPQAEIQAIKQNTKWKDVVLVEGWPAGKVFRRLSLLRLRYGLPFKVRAYGWDNMEKNEEERRLDNQAERLVDAALKLMDSDVYEAAKTIYGIRPQFDQLNAQSHQCFLDRNSTLITTLNTLMKRIRQKRKVVIIGGSRHFTHSPDVIGAISQHPHAVFNFSEQ